MGIKTHGSDLYTSHIRWSVDRALGVSQVEKTAGITKPQDVHAGFLFNVGCQFFAKGAVKDFIGFTDIGESKGDVQDTDKGIN